MKAQLPQYFRRVEKGTIRRWEQLDSDPELAAPWKQLFNQVKSPQHVISELLQNADDAGATSAWIDLDGETFSFSHNGDDFNEDQFASCAGLGTRTSEASTPLGFEGSDSSRPLALGMKFNC